ATQRKALAAHEGGHSREVFVGGSLQHYGDAVDQSPALRLSRNRSADRTAAPSAGANVNAGYLFGAAQVDLDRRASRRRRVVSRRFTTRLPKAVEHRRRTIDANHIGARFEAEDAVYAAIIGHPGRIHFIHRGGARVSLAFGIAHTVGQDPDADHRLAELINYAARDHAASDQMDYHALADAVFERLILSGNVTRRSRQERDNSVQQPRHFEIPFRVAGGHLRPASGGRVASAKGCRLGSRQRLAVIGDSPP